jgi:hypothetical protein
MGRVSVWGGVGCVNEGVAVWGGVGCVSEGGGWMGWGEMC